MAKTRKNIRYNTDKRKSVSSRKKIGGLTTNIPECTPITDMNMFSLLLMYKKNRNSLHVDFNEQYNENKQKVQVSMKIDAKDINPLGSGGFNVVYSGNNIMCKGKDSIIRVEKVSHKSPHRTLSLRLNKLFNFGSKTIDSEYRYNIRKNEYNKLGYAFIYEIQLSIFAYTIGVGPAIYKFGSTRKIREYTSGNVKTNEEYFYTVMQKIDGPDFSDYLKNIRSEDKDQAIKYINQLIEKSDKLGNYGIILYDTKPGNAMVDTATKTVYLIDYDPTFTKIDEKNKEIGYLNSVLMLAICIKTLDYFLEYYKNYKKDTNYGFAQLFVREHCNDLLDDIYNTKSDRVKYMKSKYNEYKKCVDEKNIYDCYDHILMSNVNHYGIIDVLKLK
jgi:serine/threonine protein kinase